ncbi:phospho-sugar mutase [Candidatus Poriferisodalis sp.]|uniref:phospho-sugar mutase n=1 Tax=Candidatus Poriferisodalis sp. TaxID=3101277 RepID=UPI003B02B915
MTTPEALADAWLAAEPDAAIRRDIEANRSNVEWVDAHFGSRLRFGTAGMRAPWGPGPAGMNRVMARVAARAIGSELIGCDLGQRGAVVGFDARLGSADMAFDAARLLAAMGIPTAIIDGPAPTPLLARQLLARSAGAGLMITASHNPRSDNGLKVYWSDGTQIRPPIDRRIEARMDLTSLPGDSDLAARHEVESLDVRSVIAEYVGAAVRPPSTKPVSGPLTPPQPSPARAAMSDATTDLQPAAASPRLVYTALCGVGSQTLGHAFAAAGLPPPIYVEHQRHPDGSFPGLPFPNPEEPGTLDDAIALASDTDIDVVVANDPDADRLAVAVRDRHRAWHRLSGDELGVLLCDWLIELHTGGEGVEPDAPLLSASSVVSGRMVEALCAARGVAHHRTLTGFKWVMAPRLAHPEARWVFGYEEALGYSVSDAVLDKDGISAAVEFARLAGALAARGIGPLERLDELAAEVGLYVTRSASVRAHPEAIAVSMARLRTDPPRTIADRSVAKFVDWLDLSAPLRADLVELELAPATTDGLGHNGEAQVRICIRPSGTEPKAKIYLEAACPIHGDGRAERLRLTALLDAVASEIMASLFSLE